jgi:hypothetical protein
MGRSELPRDVNMSEETKQPQSVLNYAAHLLRKLIDPNASDPAGEDLKRLNGPLFDVVMSVYSEGLDKSRRKSRMKAELSARGLDLLMQPMIDLADPQADLSALEISSGWQPFDLADVMTEDIPPIEWVVKYFLPRPSVVIFFGRAKHKKSLVILDMCHHIAGGLSWMTSTPDGNDGVDVTPARVVWVDLENGSRLLKRRMKAFAKALDIEIIRGQFQAYSMPNPWLDLSKPENVPAMIERINALGDIGVLVIDHLAQVFGSVDENSPLASQVMNAIRQISEACNISIVLIHHSKKGIGKDSGLPEDQLRGSGAILAGVDAAYLIERDLVDKNQVTIKPVAVRGPDAPNISANFVFEQDANLDLITARFWKIAYRSISARVHDAIIEALKQNEKLNHTQLRAEAKRIDPSLSDANIRDGIESLTGTREIDFSKGDKGAKIYQLAGEYETE